MYKKRIEWIDIAKGIAIILVIIGHTISAGIVRGLIFSFHMPLFFIASAYTMQFSISIKDNEKKYIPKFIRLVGTAWGLYIVKRLLFLFLYNDGAEDIAKYFLDIISTILWSSGTTIVIKGQTYEGIGMVWFLVVMAFSMCIYDLMHIKIQKMLIRGGCVYVARLLVCIYRIYLFRWI